MAPKKHPGGPSKREQLETALNGKDPQTGQFLPKNEFWKMRSSHGRKPIFPKPDDLWNACCEYFQWVADNPLYEEKAWHSNGLITKDAVAKMRAMTITGLCIFLDISFQGWTEYCAKPDFSEITTRVENIIKTQKFEGAAAEFLNANIIARDLGLADKKEHSGPDGGPIEVKETKELSREELLRIAANGPEQQNQPEK